MQRNQRTPVEMPQQICGWVKSVAVAGWLALVAVAMIITYHSQAGRG